jgi:ADP-heptose:LPS heptosyltransferase
MKILIIRFSSIGDIVLTTPVIRCLKQQLQAEIHYITKQSFQNILLFNPYVDKVYTIQKKVNEVLPELKKERYDYIIDLHKNIRSQQIRWQLRGKYLAFYKLNLEKWLMVNLKINFLPQKHIVERYLATVKSLGVTNDGQGLNYFIPEKDEVRLQDWKVEPNSYIAFVIGAAHATKRLPKEKIIVICQSITIPILLIGGPDETHIGDEIATSSGNHVKNTCGKLNLNQSASVVKRALKVITHDTGMMHIAAALDKEIISVWGNTIPEFGMYPYYKNSISRNQSIEVKGLPCRPCSKIGHDQCPKGHFNCMNQIPSQTIAELAEK